MPNANLLRLIGRWSGIAAEIAIFSVLILGPRCANYRDVFVDGKIYFVDADCYSRMTRARLVAEDPGTVVRQHDFENFPAGVKPHTTAPLDYLIVAIAALLGPFTSQPLDLAGAIVSPLLALLGGWFLWWWSRAWRWPGRYAALLVYSLSAILVHGTALGRPDHQGLLIVLLLIALAAEWRLQENPRLGWTIASGVSWGLALWVSLYEPLILLAALVLGAALVKRVPWSAPRRAGWWIILGISLLAVLVERRWPGWPGSQPFFAQWSATIGELQSISLTSPVWLQWGGGFILVAPVLLFLAWRKRVICLTIVILLLLAFVLTLWQARWGYFFALLFCLTIPAQIALVRPRSLAAVGASLALLPLLQFWDAQFWPNEEETTRRAEDRVARRQWRAAAGSLLGRPRGAVMTPWWLAPATAYWSRQPTVAGSSHESLPGIIESARFFLATSPEKAGAILRLHEVRWVLADDGDRVVENSAALLGVPAPRDALCRTLDATPSQVPEFLILLGQNGTCKLYQVRDLR